MTTSSLKKFWVLNKMILFWKRFPHKISNLDYTFSKHLTSPFSLNFHLVWLDDGIQPSQNVLAAPDFAACNEKSAIYFTLEFIDNKHQVSTGSNCNNKKN